MNITNEEEPPHRKLRKKEYKEYVVCSLLEVCQELVNLLYMKLNGRSYISVSTRQDKEAHITVISNWNQIETGDNRKWCGDDGWCDFPCGNLWWDCNINFTIICQKNVSLLVDSGDVIRTNPTAAENDYDYDILTQEGHYSSLMCLEREGWMSWHRYDFTIQPHH